MDSSQRKNYDKFMKKLIKFDKKMNSERPRSTHLSLEATMIKRSKDELQCFACDQQLPEEKVAPLKNADSKYRKMGRNSSQALPLKRKNNKLTNLG